MLNFIFTFIEIAEEESSRRRKVITTDKIISICSGKKCGASVCKKIQHWLKYQKSIHEAVTYCVCVKNAVTRYNTTTFYTYNIRLVEF